MRFKSATLFLLAACAIAAATPAHADDRYPRVQSYELDARFIPDEARMEGVAVIRFAPGAHASPQTTFCMHGELQVDSLSIDGRSVPFESSSESYDRDYSLMATISEFKTTDADMKSPLTVHYSGYFHPSEARSRSDYMRIDSTGVFLRAYAYSPWFPIFLPEDADDYSVDFPKAIIRTPSAFQPVFVGTRTGESESGGWRVSEWSAKDVSLFDAQCAAQRCVVTSQGNYFLYHYDDSLSRAAAGEIIDFATRTIGLYEKYYRHGVQGGPVYIVEMPPYGDISSGNVTGLMASTWQTFMEDANRQRALGHELVHPYVAVPVDRADSLWSVAIEGFPSYFHLPVLAENLGSEWYNTFLGWMEQLYLGIQEKGMDRRGNPMPPEIPLLSIDADKMSTYKDEFVLDDRVLLFFNYLYSRMGRDTFFAFTSDMLNRDHLTVASFRRLIEQYLPGSAADVSLWLTTNDYPERLHFDHYKRL